MVIPNTFHIKLQMGTENIIYNDLNGGIFKS